MIEWKLVEIMFPLSNEEVINALLRRHGAIINVDLIIRKSSDKALGKKPSPDPFEELWEDPFGIRFTSVSAFVDEKKLDDISRINDSLIRKNLKGIVDLSVDGGINSETIINCRETGADTFVSGSSIFWSGDVHSNVSLLKKSLGI